MQVFGLEISGDVKSARELGLVACRMCTRVWPQGTERCHRCNERLSSRDETSLQRVWAWWTVGLLCYVPANVYPMLRTRTLLTEQDNTIVGGAIELWHYASYGVAIIILTASVLIPIGKFLAVAGLAIGVQRRTSLSRERRHQLLEVIEYIGRWSMIDVFVVAILSSAVQLDILASITPGRASLFFALSVIFTMLSAQSFDSRMIWDADRNLQPEDGAERTGQIAKEPVTP